MKFLYHCNAGFETLDISGDSFLHLKAIRIRNGQRIDVRNLVDGYNYIYEVISFNKKNAVLQLIFKSLLNLPKPTLHLGWAVVEPKVVEKTIPSLNELGVGKISFVYTKFSQNNFKINLEKLQYLSALSSQQCGRNSIMDFECFSSLDNFLKQYPNSAIIHFGGKILNGIDSVGNFPLIIGPEGGFSSDEVLKFKDIYALGTKSILRSQTAIVGVAARLLL